VTSSASAAARRIGNDRAPRDQLRHGGCLPEYFPVVVTAVQAAMEEKYNLFGRQTTTNPADTSSSSTGRSAKSST
jgi:hypothetical protein